MRFLFKKNVYNNNKTDNLYYLCCLLNLSSNYLLMNISYESKKPLCKKNYYHIKLDKNDCVG